MKRVYSLIVLFAFAFTLCQGLLSSDSNLFHKLKTNISRAGGDARNLPRPARESAQRTGIGPLLDLNKSKRNANFYGGNDKGFGAFNAKIDYG